MHIPYDIKPMIGHSGRKYTYPDFVLLADLARIGTFSWNEREIEFNSGFWCRIYMEGRNDLSDHPEILTRLALRLKEEIDRIPCTHGPQKCLIGIPMAGNQLAHEVSSISRFEHSLHVRPSSEPIICFRTMRTEPKMHGNKSGMLIDPPDVAKHSYIGVENVLSTAKGSLGHLAKLEVSGYPTRAMHYVVFADWGLGGVDELKLNGYHNIRVCYFMQDIVMALVYIGMWPQEHYHYITAKFAARA